MLVPEIKAKELRGHKIVPVMSQNFYLPSMSSLPWAYRAFRIILDYLQALTPKFALLLEKPSSRFKLVQNIAI